MSSHASIHALAAREQQSRKQKSPRFLAYMKGDLLCIAASRSTSVRRGGARFARGSFRSEEQLIFASSVWHWLLCIRIANKLCTHLVVTSYRLQVWLFQQMTMLNYLQAPALYDTFELVEGFNKRIQEWLCAHIWCQVDSSDESHPRHSQLHTTYLWRALTLNRSQRCCLFNQIPSVLLYFGEDFHFWCKPRELSSMLILDKNWDSVILV